MDILSEGVEYLNTNEFTKARKVLRTICMDTECNYTPEYVIEALNVYKPFLPEYVADMVQCIRDAYNFMSFVQKNNICKILSLIAQDGTYPANDRQYTAAFLFNQGYNEEAFECFASVANDETVPLLFRVDACVYLYSSTDEKWRGVSNNVLSTIINDDTIESNKRYDIIAKFLSRKGVKPYHNSELIVVPYNERFTFRLQSEFFENKNNCIRDRLLSAQFLLQMDCPGIEMKNAIVDELFRVSESKEYDEDTRADAADIILRLGDKEQRKRARKQIVDLGFDPANKTERVKTIYDNSQNIHEFSEQVEGFVDQMMKIYDKDLSFDKIAQKVDRLISITEIDQKEKIKAVHAMRRIGIDTATFGDEKYTLREIFIGAWAKIYTFPEDIQEQLLSRLVEELVDMGDTCTSGHVGRIVNVFSGYDNTIQMKWCDQIAGNVKGRLEAIIRTLEDEELKSALLIAQTDIADDDEKQLYVDFVKEHLFKIKDELYEEFVKGGYITTEEFKRYFIDGCRQWRLIN